MSDKKSSHSTPGYMTVLLLIFVTLKTVGLVGWPWWYVLIPLWVELGVLVLSLLTLGAVKFAEEKSKAKK
jgi:hypothetical protein